MREILEYCIGGIRRNVSPGDPVVHEGGRTGHLYVLIEGRLEVVKGDTVVASITEPGAVLGEMSVLLDQPHTATVRAASDSIIYEFDDAAAFLRDQPAPDWLKDGVPRLKMEEHLRERRPLVDPKAVAAPPKVVP